MDDSRRQTASRWWIIAVVAVVVGYPLSIGPFFVGVHLGYIPNKWFLWLYFPIRHLMDESDTVSEWGVWYCLWWLELLAPILESGA